MVAEPEVPFQPTVVTPPPGALVTADPPRVCLLVMTSVNNPVCTLNQAHAACGKTPRDKVDTLTPDRKDVTCPACRKAIEETPAGEEVKVRTPEAGGAPGLVTRTPAGAQPPAGDSLAGLVGRLDVGEIEGRLKAIKGEEAALKVLLKAARARRDAMAEPATE